MSDYPISGERFETSKSYSAQSVAVPVAAVILTLLVGWFCVHRPVQTQVAGLERQCNELARLVDRLADQSTSVAQSNTILEMVSTQAAVVQSAEVSLNKLQNFHEELSNRLQNMQQFEAMSGRLAEIESTAVQERKALSSTLEALHELSETQRLVVDAGATLPEVRRTLDVMDDLHLELESQRQDAISAAQVVEDMRQICGGLLAAKPQVETAAAVAERWNVAQNRLAKQADQLAAAEQAAARLAEINSLLNEQSPDVARARHNLDRLIAVNQELGQQDELLAAAVNTVKQLHSLEPVVNRASDTVDAIQRLVVDVCLTHPADVQTVASPATSSRPPQRRNAAQRTDSAPGDPGDWVSVYQAFRMITPIWPLR